MSGNRKDGEPNKIVQIGFNEVMGWVKVDKPNGLTIVAHEHRGSPEVKLVKVKDGFESFSLIHLQGGVPISQQVDIFDTTMFQVAKLLDVEQEEALEALRDLGEGGIPYLSPSELY